MKYHDFTLSVREKISGEKLPGVYAVATHSEFTGGVEASIALDIESQELKRHLARIEGGTSTSSSLREVGWLLFNMLFQGAVRDHFYESLGEAAAREGRGLRIKLELHPPEIASLPWEFLYDQGKQGFLATDPSTPLIRYMSIWKPIRQLKVSLPIRILAAVPCASGLDSAKEIQILREAFSALPAAVEFTILDDKITHERLSDELIQAQYHLLHFIGHGVFVGDEAYIYLNNEQGGEEPLPAREFAKFLEGYGSLKLAVLNVCQGAAVSAIRPFIGLAPQIIEREIPAVVAMRYPIPDDAAILFAREFYRKLCMGPERGRVDTAICHARNRLQIEYPSKRHLGTPQLFLRAPNGIIFDIPVGERLDSHTLEDLERTHKWNLDVLTDRQKEEGDSPERQEQVEQSMDGIRRVRRIIRWRNISIFGVVLPLFFASWVGLLNILSLDESVEQILVHLGNHLSPPPWDDSIQLVGVDQESRAVLQLTKDSDIRHYHAQILPKLAKAGARVMALDYSFHGVSEYNSELAQAIQEARAQGSAVVVGETIYRIEGSQVIPELPQDLREVVSGWAVAGKGVLGEVAGYVRKVRLLELRNHDIRIPFFGLQVVYYGLQAKHLELNKDEDLITLYNHEQKEIPLLHKIETETGRPLFRPTTQPRWLEIYIRFSPLTTLERSTVPYHRLLHEREDSLLWQTFRDKLVLIGGTQPGGDEHYTYQGERRFGVQILADGINTILQEQYIRPLGTPLHILIFLLMSSTAAFLRWRTPPRRKVWGRGILLTLAVLYLVAALYLYIWFLVLSDVIYHLLALFLTYWAVGLVRRRLA